MCAMWTWLIDPANQNTVTAFGTLFSALAAVLSLAVALYAFLSERHHNRLLVKPFGEIRVGDYEDKIHVKILNCGMGPLIVEKVLIKDESGNFQDKPLYQFMPTLTEGNAFEDFVSAISKRVLAPGENAVLISYCCDPDDKTSKSDREKIRSALSKLTVKLEFNDIFLVPQEPAERELTWFAR